MERKKVLNNKKPLELTEQQINTLLALSKMKMSWIAFYMIISSFSICLIALIFEAFYFQTGWLTKILLGFIEGTLAYGFKRIFAFLFPTLEKQL